MYLNFVITDSIDFNLNNKGMIIGSKPTDNVLKTSFELKDNKGDVLYTGEIECTSDADLSFVLFYYEEKNSQVFEISCFKNTVIFTLNITDIRIREQFL